MKRVFLILIAGLLLGLLVLAAYVAGPYARIATSYKAKAVCSEVFVADRSLDDVVSRDFDRVHPVVSASGVDLDRTERTVRVSLFGLLGRAKAVHRPGYGCSLAINGRPSGDQRRHPDVTPSPWSIAEDADVQTLVEEVMAGTDGPVSTDIRAIVVIKDGQIVAESYADGFGPDRPMQSWSMAKSVTQAMASIAIDQGILSLSDRELMPDWTGSDPRADITVADLLHMVDGLDFVEDYGDPASDVSRMLFDSRHMGLSASESSLAHAPGTHWAYSSGTSNILSAVLRRAIEASGQDYHDWPYRYIFGPIGMTTPIFETDAGGTFIGSSYLYASPRDWARLGQLYLNNGLWNGRRILPEGAVDFARTPYLPDQAPIYGAHWWTNAALPDGRRRLPGLPDDAYFMGGHDGQRVIVIPSRNAVLVRLGLTRPPVDEDRDVMPGLAAIVDAL